VKPKEIEVGGLYLWQEQRYQNSGELVPKRRVRVLDEPYLGPSRNNAVNKGIITPDTPLGGSGATEWFVRCQTEEGEEIVACVDDLELDNQN
jgi:hypothetical protein